MSALLKFVGTTGKTPLGFVVNGLTVYAPAILVDELVASGDFVLVDNSSEPVDKPVDKSGESVDNSGKEPAEKPKAKKKGGKK